MTEPARYSAPPIELPLDLGREPAPVEGCAGRVELAAVRSRARAVGDWTTVTDCNVFMRRHPEGH
ncbi:MULTISPECIES: hypothetical protein [unclassified Streptomyces]|uniref:hypothetical protein n=1 Tax=unclassified Streptomyces TaxID=2593676 RepID=UPI0006F66E0C|nr:MULTISPECIES: hypothetical protein [unclassified Streptomyces]KQX59381.1 hypothetical protein ASD33_03620 [Streptomyces sp. Root1304]KRB00642.1 hypothetical protein ASE09_03620 [Streptomyces sp. Root66D1]